MCLPSYHMGVKRVQSGAQPMFLESFGGLFLRVIYISCREKSESADKQEERKQHSQSCRLEISLVSEQCLNVDLFS